MEGSSVASGDEGRGADVSIEQARSDLWTALYDWKNSGGDLREVLDSIEGLVSAKVYEILQARADNARGTQP